MIYPWYTLLLVLALRMWYCKSYFTIILEASTLLLFSKDILSNWFRSLKRLIFFMFHYSAVENILLITQNPFCPFFTKSLKNYTSTVPNEISQITEMKLLINSRNVKIIRVLQGGWIMAAIFVQTFRSGKGTRVIFLWKLLKSAKGLN